jgi:hypothetical protein
MLWPGASPLAAALADTSPATTRLADTSPATTSLADTSPATTTSAADGGQLFIGERQKWRILRRSCLVFL